MDLFSKIAISNLENLVKKLLDSIGEEVQFISNNKILEYQKEQFIRNYEIKTFLHRAVPKPLPEIYFPLAVRTVGGKSNIFTINSIGQLFDESQYITLIGTAGSGKSTLLRYLVLKSLEEDFKIPIKIELRYLKDFNLSLKDFILEKVFKLAKFSKIIRITERLLLSGKFIFFLDGYDEINAEIKEKTTKEIDELVNAYSKNYFVITTRPNSNIELLPLFHNYYIVELNDKDILKFVQLQLSGSDKEKEIALKVIDSIKDQKNKSYLSFLTNPLLLSMYILTFQSYARIPQKKSTFYSQVFETLFSIHDSISKFSFAREKESQLSKEEFIEVLKIFSFINFFEDNSSFHKNKIEQQFNLIKEKKKQLNFVNSSLLHDLQVALCILSKDTEIQYSFNHKSFQEYFAALYLSQLEPEPKNILYKKIIERFILDEDCIVVNIEEFYILCKELDYFHFMKDFVLPILNRLNEYVNEVLKQEELEMNKFRDTCNFLIKLENLADILELNFYNKSKILFISNSQKEIYDLPSDDSIMLYERMKNILINYLKGVSTEIYKKINEVSKQVEEYGDSDFQIISILE